MPRILQLLGLLICVTLTSGCGVLKKHMMARKNKKAPVEKGTEVFIGVVESVNPEQKFVLVRMDMRMNVAPGTKLEARSMDGARAMLVVSPEHKMNFLSADITEGTPSAGDIVIMPAQSAPVSAPAPQPQVPVLHPASGSTFTSELPPPTMRVPQ